MTGDLLACELHPANATVRRIHHVLDFAGGLIDLLDPLLTGDETWDLDLVNPVQEAEELVLSGRALRLLIPDPCKRG